MHRAPLCSAASFRQSIAAAGRAGSSGPHWRDGQDDPMFPDGVSGCSCVTGGMLVSVLNVGKERVADFVTQVRAGKVPRTPLPMALLNLPPPHG